MPDDYRAYQLDDSDHIQRRHEFEAENNEKALIF